MLSKAELIKRYRLFGNVNYFITAFMYAAISMRQGKQKMGNCIIAERLSEDASQTPEEFA